MRGVNFRGFITGRESTVHNGLPLFREPRPRIASVARTFHASTSAVSGKWGIIGPQKLMLGGTGCHPETARIRLKIVDTIGYAELS